MSKRDREEGADVENEAPRLTGATDGQVSSLIIPTGDKVANEPTEQPEDTELKTTGSTGDGSEAHEDDSVAMETDQMEGDHEEAKLDSLDGEEDEEEEGVEEEEEEEMANDDEEMEHDVEEQQEDDAEVAQDDDEDADMVEVEEEEMVEEEEEMVEEEMILQQEEEMMLQQEEEGLEVHEEPGKQPEAANQVESLAAGAEDLEEAIEDETAEEATEDETAEEATEDETAEELGDADADVADDADVVEEDLMATEEEEAVVEADLMITEEAAAAEEEEEAVAAEEEEEEEEIVAAEEEAVVVDEEEEEGPEVVATKEEEEAPGAVEEEEGEAVAEEEEEAVAEEETPDVVHVTQVDEEAGTEAADAEVPDVDRIAAEGEQDNVEGGDNTSSEGWEEWSRPEGLKELNSDEPADGLSEEPLIAEQILPPGDDGMVTVPAAEVDLTELDENECVNDPLADAAAYEHEPEDSYEHDPQERYAEQQERFSGFETDESFDPLNQSDEQEMDSQSDSSEEDDEMMQVAQTCQKLACAGERCCTGLVYSKLMKGHRDSSPHPEQPRRVSAIYNRLVQQGLASQCVRILCRDVTVKELQTVHTSNHIKTMLQMPQMAIEALNMLESVSDSVYLHPLSAPCALLAAGSVIEATQWVVEGKVKNAVAIVRPPGHHAEADCPMGFCIFGNVALAAHAARYQMGCKRVLIVDWDVHHGNGTQRMFESDPSVLYFSAHRFDQGTFYPGGVYGDFTSVGSGEGEGFSVNVPWSSGMMGDEEYLRAFKHIFMPIAHEFDPDLVLISAGFDACRGDPLGGCDVTAAGFGELTQMLMQLAGGKIVLALEGGYNLDSISHSFAACTQALLGQKLPSRVRGQCRQNAKRVIGRVRHHLLPYWKSLLPLPGYRDVCLPAAPMVEDVRHVFVHGYWEMCLRGLMDLPWMPALCEGVIQEPATVQQASLHILHSQPHAALLSSAAIDAAPLRGFLLSLPPQDGDRPPFALWLESIDRVQGYPQTCQRLVVVAETRDEQGGKSRKTLAYVHYQKFGSEEQPEGIEGQRLTSGSWAVHLASLQMEAAIRSGDVGAIRVALSKGADPNFTDTSLLLLAISHASGLRNHEATLEAVKLLLHHGAQAAHNGRSQLAPLHVAGSRGLLEVVQALVTAGAIVDEASDDGVTPLWLASLNGHTAVVEALVAAGANVNSVALNGSTPVHAAAAHGRLNTLLVLHKLGAMIDLPGFNGLTPIHVAAAKGFQAVVSALSRMGAATTGQVTTTPVARRKRKLDPDKVLQDLSSLSQISGDLRSKMHNWRRMLATSEPTSKDSEAGRASKRPKTSGTDGDGAAAEEAAVKAASAGAAAEEVAAKTASADSNAGGGRKGAKGGTAAAGRKGAKGGGNAAGKGARSRGVHEGKGGRKGKGKVKETSS